MRPRGSALIGILGGAGLIAVVIFYAAWGLGVTGAAQSQTPTPYHEGFPSPVASPDGGHSFPLPGTQDVDTGKVMTAAGISMLQAAQSMENAAAALAASGNPALAGLEPHWAEDARALRDRGVWMIETISSAGMIHDPQKARELDLDSLQVNGKVMQAEGEAMTAHGREMASQVQQLRDSGAIEGTTADPLLAAGKALITTGDQMAQDGKTMQQTAENLLKSIGA